MSNGLSLLLKGVVSAGDVESLGSISFFIALVALADIIKQLRQ